MANPLAFGFMPMTDALSMNWEQSLGRPSSYDVQLGVMDAMQQNARQNYGNSPFGDSFLRRFTGTSPLGLGVPEAPQQPAPDLAMLQGALAQAAQESGQFMNQFATRRTGIPYSGPAIDASNAPLRAQPWYDEYVAAAQGGADLPMVVGGGGRPVDQGKADAYRANRAQDMAARRNAVQQNAIYENEQRQVRMGDMSENQQYFNELARLQGALGGQQGGGQNLMNGIMFGPEAMVGMDRNNAERDMTRAKLDFAGSPAGWVAGAFANGQPTPDVYSGQRAIADPLGSMLGSIAAASPTREEFLRNAMAAGVPPQVAEQESQKYYPPEFVPADWTETLFGADRKWNGINTPWTDPNRSTARGFLGNWLSDALGVE